MSMNAVAIYNTITYTNIRHNRITQAPLTLCCSKFSSISNSVSLFYTHILYICIPQRNSAQKSPNLFILQGAEYAKQSACTRWRMWKSLYVFSSISSSSSPSSFFRIFFHLIVVVSVFISFVYTKIRYIA